MTSPASNDYRLLDSGDGRKLEQVGPHLLNRQAPGAVWKRTLPRAAWQKADAYHHRSESGGGTWEYFTDLPETWQVHHGGLLFEIKPTPFGHLGLFAEQADQWGWLRNAVAGRKNGEPLRILNLFAYTGGSTLALAEAGAAVSHVDAARGVVDWARRNAALNGLGDRPVRWIVDDCLGFVRREERRGRKYNGIVIDPPSFGRGRNQEIFKIDRDLRELLDACRRVLVDPPRLFLLTSHTPGYTPGVLRNLIGDLFSRSSEQTEAGEMGIDEQPDGRRLPAGAFSRLLSE